MTDQSINSAAVSVAAVQLRCTMDAAANRATADALVREAAAAGARLVVLPEKVDRLGPPAEVAQAAEPLDGPFATWARALAAELRIDLVAGSFEERVEGDERRRNTSLHVGPDGQVRATYRKLHLFDVDVEGRRYRESEHEAPGDEVVVSATAHGVGLGLTVCYDLRFPELHRALALAGARVLVVPAAFTAPTTRAGHWETLLRARAIEQQCFVVAANQVGEHAPGLASGGCSMVVDPWGEVLARLGDAEPGIALATLDLRRQDEVRAQLPALGHRRPEVYEHVRVPS